MLPCHPHLNGLTVTQVHCSGLLYSYDYRELLRAAGLNSVWFRPFNVCVCVCVCIRESLSSNPWFAPSEAAAAAVRHRTTLHFYVFSVKMLQLRSVSHGFFKKDGRTHVRQPEVRWTVNTTREHFFQSRIRKCRCRVFSTPVNLMNDILELNISKE